MCVFVKRCIPIRLSERSRRHVLNLTKCLDYINQRFFLCGFLFRFVCSFFRRSQYFVPLKNSMTTKTNETLSLSLNVVQYVWRISCQLSRMNGWLFGSKLPPPPPPCPIETVIPLLTNNSMLRYSIRFACKWSNDSAFSMEWTKY